MTTKTLWQSESTEPECRQVAQISCLLFCFSDGLVQNCVTLLQWFRTKQQHFKLSSAQSHLFHDFEVLKPHTQELWLHSQPIFFTFMHAHKPLNNET